MSHQEAKQEIKELEGNVEVKAKVRARMREMANRRMLAAVPRADLVVMNPTHYAVALQYDDATMAAPRVLAKGADLMALRIRDAADAAKVPVLRAPPLARALYTHAEVDREIPAQLFSAVAQVLAWVYQLRAAMAARAAMPVEPPAAVPAGARSAARQLLTQGSLLRSAPISRRLSRSSRRRRPEQSPRMNALSALGALLGKHDGAVLLRQVAAPLVILLVLAMMVLPLPAFALDLLFTFNIAMALMVMMVAAQHGASRSTSRRFRRCC